MPSTKLFISYRSLDSIKVDMIVSRLRTLEQYDIWQDKIGIIPGQDWWEAIVNAIINCNIFIFMLSRASAQNPNCRAELSYAYKRNRYIIPVVLEGEFLHNPKTGKNDINYWDELPLELKNERIQFLFYEGSAGFIKQLENAVEEYKKKPPKDFPAPRPLDPRDTTNLDNNITIYDEACDYAGRMEFSAAERLFQHLVRVRDDDFEKDAHEWILLLHEYKKIIMLDSTSNTRHKVQAAWEKYKQMFPKSFIQLFDPQGFALRENDLNNITKNSVKTNGLNPKN